MIEPCLSYKILMALSEVGMTLPDFDEAQETVEKVLSCYSCEKEPCGRTTGNWCRGAREERMRRMTDRAKLKPCPFCGTDKPLFNREDCANGGVFVFAECRRCWAKGPTFNRNKTLDDEVKGVDMAIYAWNERAKLVEE